jgi:hypothetical protein
MHPTLHTAQPVLPKTGRLAAVIDSHWPPEEPAYRPQPQEIDDDTPLELDDEYWEALAPDDDYEPFPEQGDFWTEDGL